MGAGRPKKASGFWSRFSAFWKSLPVVLQAITAVLVAFAGLIGAAVGLAAVVGPIINPTPSPNPVSSGIAVVSPGPTAPPTATTPTAPPVSIPPSTLPTADLRIIALTVASPNGYPVLSFYVSNPSSILVTVTRIKYEAEDPPGCGNDGLAPPQVPYDVLLPKLQGSDAIVLSQPNPVAPGALQTIELSVGRASSTYDYCYVRPKLSLVYADPYASTFTTEAWPDPITLKVRPLKKCPTLLCGVIIGPSIGPIQQ